MSDFIIDFRNKDQRNTDKAIDLMTYFADIKVRIYDNEEFTLALSRADDWCVWAPYKSVDDNIFILVHDQQCLDGIIAVIPDPPPLARYSEDIKAVDFRHKFIDFISKEEGIEIDQPGPYAPYSYDALYILIEAMKRANSVLPGDYIKELKSISYDGLIGHIEFDFKGDMLDPASTVFVIRDGAWVRYQK